LRTLFIFVLIWIATDGFGQKLVVETMTDTTIERWESHSISQNGESISTIHPSKLIIRTCTLAVGKEDQGKRVGPWTFNSCNEEQTLSVQAVCQAGYLDGEYISYYPDGQVKSRFHFKKDSLKGEFACFNTYGILQYSGSIDQREDSTYANGKEFYPTGSFKRERRFLIETLRKNFLNEIEKTANDAYEN
jgi:antitoxin component YwqK of YwqJK toxin-antitoxin module